MSKRINALIWLPLFISCQTSTSTSEFAKIAENYGDFEEKFIVFDDCFNQLESRYLIYFYSESCYYCNTIKKDVLGFVGKEIVAFYFIEYVKGIPIFPDVDNTIGCTDINSLFIAGTPTVIDIKDHAVFSNIVGANEVKNYLQLIEENIEDL